MSREAADKLDGHIRRMATSCRTQPDTLGELIAQAKAGRIHETLGFPDWTAYLADTLRELYGAADLDLALEPVQDVHDPGGASAPPFDLDEESAIASDTDAGSQGNAKAEATTSRDGKGDPRKRQKRPKRQGRQEKPRCKNRAEVLYALLVEYLEPASLGIGNVSSAHGCTIV